MKIKEKTWTKQWPVMLISLMLLLTCLACSCSRTRTVWLEPDYQEKVFEQDQDYFIVSKALWRAKLLELIDLKEAAALAALERGEKVKKPPKRKLKVLDKRFKIIEHNDQYYLIHKALWQEMERQLAHYRQLLGKAKDE